MDSSVASSVRKLLCGLIGSCPAGRIDGMTTPLTFASCRSSVEAMMACESSNVHLVGGMGR